MSLLDKTQVISTLGECMQFMAPANGGSIPDVNSDEYAQWQTAIQLKQEEASKRGFWRRLLTSDILQLRTGDTSVTLPTRFQRPNGLYSLVVDGVELCDPDRRDADDQSILVEMINDPTDEEFGLWRVTFAVPTAADQDAPIYYFATPPTPVESTDKLILPGDMVAFGAMIELFRTSNLVGSEDDAKQEYENRLQTYLNMEMLPGRSELLTFTRNPSKKNFTRSARRQYMIRPNRNGGF
jgi:hypothetical protein